MFVLVCIIDIVFEMVMPCAVIISVLISMSLFVSMWLAVRGLFLSLSDSVCILGHEHEARGGKWWHEMSFKVASEGSFGLSGELDILPQGLKRYQCSLCDYSNDRLFNFQRHMRRHTGEMFVCDLCGARYNCKYMLTKHKRKEHSHLSQHVDAATPEQVQQITL